MKAIVVDETGGPEVLKYTEVTEPKPGPGEVLVEVEAAGVNFIDTYHRGGLYPMDLPLTPGLEGVGVIEEAGDGVTDLVVGDRIGWAQSIGTYSEKATVSVDTAVPVPMRIDPKVAAAVLLQGITAHYLAIDTYPVGPGDTCLIHAGAGGVGLLLTQIAKLRGARVITTVGTTEKAALSRGAGADEVIVYTESAFDEVIAEKFGPQSLDVVYDGVGKTTFLPSLDLLRPRGMMVTFGNASGPAPEISPLVLSQKGSLFLTRPKMGDYIASREALVKRTGDIFGWIETGDLVVTIGSEYALEDAEQAHIALEARATTGKVLLIP